MIFNSNPLKAGEWFLCVEGQAQVAGGSLAEQGASSRAQGRGGGGKLVWKTGLAVRKCVLSSPRDSSDRTDVGELLKPHSLKAVKGKAIGSRSEVLFGPALEGGLQRCLQAWMVL